jgi:hypothetical protein
MFLFSRVDLIATSHGLFSQLHFMQLSLQVYGLLSCYILSFGELLRGTWFDLRLIYILLG